MLGGTVLQGLLPTFQHGPVAGTIGVSFLVFLRLLQGISAGGEIASVTTYITEVCHPRVLARTLVLMPITSNVGYFLAQLVSFGAEEFFGEDSMHSWGWRVPFLLAVFPGALAALGRRSIPESELFLEAKVQSSSSAVSKTRQLLASYWPQIIVGFGAVAAVSVVLYGGMTWGLVSMKKKGLSSSFRILAGCGANSLVILMAPLVGWVTDVRGAAWVQTFAGLCMAVVGMPLMMMIEWSVVYSPWSAVALLFTGLQPVWCISHDALPTGGGIISSGGAQCGGRSQLQHWRLYLRRLCADGLRGCFFHFLVAWFVACTERPGHRADNVGEP